MTNEKDKALALSIPLGVSCVCGMAHVGSICARHQRIMEALTTIRKEEREAAFAAIGVELRRYGANIRKVDLLARFQELFRELETAATAKGENDG